MIYLDTSFILPLYLLEPSSSRVERVLLARPPGSAALSPWVRVEFASALAKNVRMGAQTHEKATELLAAFDRDFDNAFAVLTPTQETLDLAADLVMRDPHLGLRGGDALHLALAKAHDLALYTLDKTLLQAARALGVAADDAGIL